MSAFQPLPSNATTTPTLLLDTRAPADALLADAVRRVDATRGMASALSMIGDETRGLSGKDVAAFGLVVEILTSDAVALLDALERAQQRNKGDRA